MPKQLLFVESNLSSRGPSPQNHPEDSNNDIKTPQDHQEGSDNDTMFSDSSDFLPALPPDPTSEPEPKANASNADINDLSTTIVDMFSSSSDDESDIEIKPHNPSPAKPKLSPKPENPRKRQHTIKKINNLRKVRRIDESEDSSSDSDECPLFRILMLRRMIKHE